MQKDELSTNQRKAIAALLTCPTIAKAAEQCGLTERTLYNYLADQAFRAELRKRQDAILNAITSSLVGLSGKAIETLQNILENEAASDSVKVRAALGWLREKRQTIELEQLAERVAALERFWEARN